MALTPKQQRFVEEYLVDLNATQAAIRAGYSENRASELGYQLLQKTPVQNAIYELKQQRSQSTGITAEKVLLDIMALKEKCEREIVTEAGVRMENPSVSAKCLEMLGKHVGLFEKDNKQQQPQPVSLTVVYEN